MLRRRCTSSLIHHFQKRGAACGGGGGSGRKGLVLGVYDGCNPGEFKLTNASAQFNETQSGKINELLKGSGVPLGQALVFSNLGDEFSSIAVAGLGAEGVGYDSLERMDMCKENIRVAAGTAAKKLYDQGVNQIYVESFSSAEPAAEGANLAVWNYQDLKSMDNRKPVGTIEHYEPGSVGSDKDEWEKGVFKAEAQNLARYLEEVPANLMTPTIFAENTIEALCPCGVTVDVHDADWMDSKKMGAILALAKTSCEPPLFLELKYCGGATRDQPVVLIGKGVTFDTGGLCTKPCRGMSEYRGDLAGAAVVMATVRCAARLALPINLIGLVPLCEHLFGGMASRPGDIVVASNGKSIRIVDPNNDGVILLSDACAYSEHHKPCLTIAVSTLTEGMKATCGTGASGTVCNSNQVWWEMDRAGGETGDRFWRFPGFWEVYRKKIADFPGVDVCNVGKGNGSSCYQAAFLKEFMHDVDFAHVDIAGTGMLANGVGHPYLAAGVMSGRPTRSLIQLLYQIACPHTKGDDC